VALLKVPQKARDRCTNAEQAFAAKKVDEATKQVNQSLSIYPKNPRALTLRGILQALQQKPAAAMQDFQSAIDIDANYDPAYTAMSAIYNSQGRFDEAERTTERAVAIAPNAWQGYFEMARAYVGKGMYQKALELANRAQSLGANSVPSIHLVKAYAMVPLKLYRDASQELQAFLSHAPEGQNIEPVRQLLAQVQAAENTAAPSATRMGFAPTH
jgi:tetratricopeptide (TPR) repeat protein